MVKIALQYGQTHERGNVALTSFRRFAPMMLAAGLALGLALSTPASAQQGKTIEVFLDRAEVSPLPAKTSTLIVGNPMIADANVQSGGLIVITGKGIGSTNVMALDAQGTILANTTIRVRAGRAETVQVYRGAERETYQCSPICEPVVALGDSKEHFDRSISQNSVRMKSATDQNASDRR